MRSKKFVKSFLIIAIVAVATFGGLYFYTYNKLLNKFDYPFDNREFESLVWKEQFGSYKADNPRGEMYDDLIENYLHQGLPKNQVIDMLGEPDRTNYSTENNFNYILGMWSGWRVDHDFLYIEFDEDNLVDVFYRVQH